MEQDRLEQALLLLWTEYCRRALQLSVREQNQTCVESARVRFEVMRRYSLREIAAFVEGRWSDKGRIG